MSRLTAVVMSNVVRFHDQIACEIQYNNGFQHPSNLEILRIDK